ncbi:MAG: MerR family transcriptional regulator [Candidatus Endonucleobacter bathymodioli]|uniref:MerR family transcriptional regulator n=1 Tax=Candidatus Endonucleibacter bathymodioli TaxID=539814 RepID=A0AA90SCY1_9GAMM|nr:MerR family transcriptional regulator [Candidatus Endonucleobacter bathymodioli]
MLENELRTSELPVIPDKIYFTIGEVSDLCRVKSHVLRYWEQEFKQLSPMRRGNRRYYRRADVLLIRKIRNLLYDQRFTIDGARWQLSCRKASTPKDETHLSASPNKQQGQDAQYYRRLIQQTIVDLESLMEQMSR